MRGVSIRRAAGPADLDTVFDLLLATGLSTVRARITATLAGSSYWLAVGAGEQVLGCIGLEHGAGASLMRSAAVHPDAQGTGIGAELAATALAASRARGDHAVYLFSTGAGGYWRRLGFSEVAVRELAEALPGVPQVRSAIERGWLHDEVAWVLHHPTGP